MARMDEPIHRVGLIDARFVRKTDPHTSILAAQKASKASRKAILAVASVMNDGQARIDEEIWGDCREQGYLSSFSTVRHGRLALSEAGFLVETGGTKTTRDGSPSRLWVKALDDLVGACKRGSDGEDG